MAEANTCPSCRGKGGWEENCTRCGGTGLVGGGNACPQCYGTGNRWHKCPSCGGKKK